MGARSFAFGKVPLRFRYRHGMGMGMVMRYAGRGMLVSRSSTMYPPGGVRVVCSMCVGLSVYGDEWAAYFKGPIGDVGFR